MAKTHIKTSRIPGIVPHVTPNQLPLRLQCAAGAPPEGLRLNSNLVTTLPMFKIGLYSPKREMANPSNSHPEQTQATS